MPDSVIANALIGAVQIWTVVKAGFRAEGPLTIVGVGAGGW